MRISDWSSDVCSSDLYNFRLTDLANAMPLPLGTLVSADLTPANATAAYRFAAEAGETFVFDAIAARAGVRWRLIDPFGNMVFNQRTLPDIDGQTLEFPGTYTLLLEGEVGQGAVAGYAFAVYTTRMQDALMPIGDPIATTLAHTDERGS